MIAYDAILGCGGDWTELCNRAMFHGGECSFITSHIWIPQGLKGKIIIAARNVKFKQEIFVLLEEKP